jgi:subtilase family serine protease
MGIPLVRQRGVACVAAVVLAVAGAGLSLARPADARSAHAAACTRASGTARCGALVVQKAGAAEPLTTAGPSGLSPSTIKSVYDFPTAATAGAQKTIAIVTAFDAPTVASDLNVFTNAFGLPACTRANGCFRKVNQNGGRTLPKVNRGWALEANLDVQWAHAIAPGAKILLVEATNNSMSNLMKAVDYAKNHAQYVSMSWGTDEYPGQITTDRRFEAPGVSFFAAAGDDGVPALYPGTSPNVVSVGGTSLDMSTTTVKEYGWSGGGGGCSRFGAAHQAQLAYSGYASTGCAGKRAAPDVSLDADPSSGVAVYDSTTYMQHKGWFVVGGTSLAAPLVAGRAAAGGTVVDANTIYGSSITFRDITIGNNGASCTKGYELCTGRGSWTG